ncbi:MAG: XrtA/PEP-CTERM system exopolysaccharide export protein [Burkholderiaceae bacterium]
MFQQVFSVLKHALSIVLAGVVAVSAVGCASNSGLPAAPAKANVAEYQYVIGALDTLSITVWRNPELSASVQVRPDGRISTPLVQDLEAVGKTPQQLSKEIEKRLANYIREPVVTVVVSGFQGPYGEQVRVIGEATKPQSVPFRQNMTLLDVMILVGGLTDFADGNSAVIVRGREGGKQYKVRVRDLIKRGDISANVEVMPGDILIIPQSWF